MIIVTGGAGFIGSVIVSKLNKEGISDILIVDSLKSSEKWKNLVGKKYTDYLDKSKLPEYLNSNKSLSIEAIIHMGACSSTTEKNADYLMENNYKYTKFLAEYCIEKNIRFIYASSAATYGNGSKGFSDDHALIPDLKPLNMYGYSKQLFDEWVLMNKLEDKVVGIKFFNVFGPNEYHKGDMSSVIYKSYFQILEDKKISLFKSYNPDFGHGEQKRDFIYIKDCAEVIWQFLNKKEINGIFNLGTGNARSWKDLANAVFHAMQIHPNIEFIEMPDYLKPKYQYFTQADMTKLNNSGIKISFTTLEDAVKDYVCNYLDKDISHE
jgi:ADP-L-glycero-D-manno-heptose 6-epimerase